MFGWVAVEKWYGDGYRMATEGAVTAVGTIIATESFVTMAEQIVDKKVVAS
jgi:hypothetical protein